MADQLYSLGKQETAFRYAVDRINNNRALLNTSLLSAQIEKIPPRDSFHTYQRGLYRAEISCDKSPPQCVTCSSLV